MKLIKDDLSDPSYSAVFLQDNLAFQDAVDRYKKRRTQLLNNLEDICIIQGVTAAFSQQNPWLNRSKNLYQDPIFLYLTGLNQNNCAIILNPFNKSCQLLLPNIDEKKVFWEGVFIGLSEDAKQNQAIANALGYDSIALHDDRYATLTTQLQAAAKRSCSTFFFESPDANKQLKDHSFLSKKELDAALPNTTIKNIEPLLDHRPCLDAHDAHLMAEANTHTANAFIHCCKQLAHCRRENDVAAILKQKAYEASFLGESFAPIVAQGENACILHYNANNAALEKGNLLLLDFGCRAGSIPADISRTIPISGRFNPLQKLLYTIVLEAQALVEASCKEGVLIEDLNKKCWAHIETQLHEKITANGGVISRPYQDKPHNVSHLIGHMVHDGDPYRRYYKNPLKAGMVISNEPGLYGYFECRIDGHLYQEHCGIRIEDDLLVTARGCKNLSSDCPKSIEDIEALLR